MNKKKLAVPLAALALVASAGGGIVAAAHADTINTASTTQAVQASASTSSTSAASAQADRPQGPHKNANGDQEAPLTGADLQKATDAALAAVPGSTIDRAETDVDGDAYEAHMTKADGSQVTVKFDSNFAVSKVETGGSGGHGGHGPRANDNDADDAAASTTSS